MTEDTTVGMPTEESRDEQGLSRREFLGRVGKGVIPAFAFLGLATILNGCGSHSMGVPDIGCPCGGTCKASCEGSCRGGCWTGCGTGCHSTVQYG